MYQNHFHSLFGRNEDATRKKKKKEKFKKNTNLYALLYKSLNEMSVHLKYLKRNKSGEEKINKQMR